MADLNERTNLPHRMSLGDVLGAIEMSPGEIAAFLTGLAEQFRDSAHPNLARNFADHAALVTNPATFGYRAPEGPQNPQERPYEPPSAGSVAYGVKPPGGPSGQQSAQATQGQSTTPGTVSTPSQEQQAENQRGAAPTLSPSPAFQQPDDFATATDVLPPATNAPADVTGGNVAPASPEQRPRTFDPVSNTWRYADNSEAPAK